MLDISEFTPRGEYVMVEIVRKSPSGIVLPETVQPATHMRMVVRAVGEQVEGLKEGDEVLPSRSYHNRAVTMPVKNGTEEDRIFAIFPAEDVIASKE